VTSSVSRPHLDVQELLRRTARSELGRVDLSQIRDGRWILSLTLVRMETKLGARRAETTAVVSATVRAERGGALFAVLGGRARLQDARGSVQSLEVGALRVAVRGAMARLPEALR
jgi:hypothetical protein